MPKEPYIPHVEPQYSARELKKRREVVHSTPKRFDEVLHIASTKRRELVQAALAENKEPISDSDIAVAEERLVLAMLAGKAVRRSDDDSLDRYDGVVDYMAALERQLRPLGGDRKDDAADIMQQVRQIIGNSVSPRKGLESAPVFEVFKSMVTGEREKITGVDFDDNTKAIRDVQAAEMDYLIASLADRVAPLGIQRMKKIKETYVKAIVVRTKEAVKDGTIKTPTHNAYGVVAESVINAIDANIAEALGENRSAKR